MDFWHDAAAQKRWLRRIALLIGLLLVPVFGYVAVCLASPAAWIMADCFLIPAYFYAMRTLKKAMPDAVTA